MTVTDSEAGGSSPRGRLNMNTDAFPSTLDADSSPPIFRATSRLLTDQPTPF
jgi:hypothetical protein